MEMVRHYIARTGLDKLPRAEFVHKYASGSPLLLGLRGQTSDETARVMTVIITPGELRRQANPLDRFVYPVEKVDGRNTFNLWVTLGRAPNNDLIVPNSSVSKFHATFRKVGAQYVLCDRNSTNGTVLLKGDAHERLVSNTERSLEDRCTIEFGGDSGEVMQYLACASSVYDVLSKLNGK